MRVQGEKLDDCTERCDNGESEIQQVDQQGGNPSGANEVGTDDIQETVCSEKSELTEISPAVLAWFVDHTPIMQKGGLAPCNVLRESRIVKFAKDPIVSITLYNKKSKKLETARVPHQKILFDAICVVNELRKQAEEPKNEQP